MGIFDNAVPGGNITKPILIALGALLAGKLLSGSSKDADNDAETPVDRQVPPPSGNAPHQQTGAPQEKTGQEQAGQTKDTNGDQPPAGPGNGGLLDGIDGFLKRLKEAGQGETADSWVKPDTQNKPIEPQDLGKAIGGKVLSELSRRTGIPEDQLLEQLSKALPGVVDKLTPNGKVPTNDQVAGQLRNSPW